MNEAQRRLFSEIRSLLQRAPDAQVWAEVCEYMSHWRERETFEQSALPYALGHLSGWPDELRAVPLRWRDALVRGIDLPWTPIVRALDASRMGLRDADMLALVHAPVLKFVTRLDLTDNRLDARALGKLLDAVAPGQLHTLHLSGNLLGDDGVRVLASHPALSGLRVLEIGRVGMSDVGLRALLHSVTLPALEVLRVRQERLDGAQTARALAEARVTPRALELVEAGMTPHALEALLEGPLLDSLRALDLSGNELGFRGGALLARSPRVAGLRALRLRRVMLGERALDVLVRSEQVEGIGALDVSHNHLGDEGVRYLGQPTCMPQLRALGVARVGVSAATLHMLCNARRLHHLALAPGDLATRDVEILRATHPRLTLHMHERLPDEVPL